ncbi:MAG TPA: FecR family protein [Chitinophagaceae bacterium]|nr:FecR family protein [Chitinophagaceae bacterium]
MDKIKLLIQKLWADKFSNQELQLLASFFEDQDNELRIELYNSFYQSGGGQKIPVDDKRANEILYQLLVKIRRKESRKARIISFARFTGWVAASVILVVAGLHFFRLSPEVKTNSVAYSISSPRFLKVVSNTADTNMQITMTDKSLVTLFPHTTISFYEFFETNARNIRLDGKAFFKVARDKNRPFSVYSNGLTTTALGTQFSVNMNEKNKIEIKLYEGKVLIHAADKNLHAINDIYLIPGQSFAASIPDKRYVLSVFTDEKTLPDSHNKHAGIHMDPDLQFDKEPLYAVFDKLSKRYHTRIAFTKSKLEGLYFTGTINASDSLQTILSIITNMNGLRFEEQGDYLLIRSQK